MVLTKLHLGFLKIEILTNFSKFQIHHCTLWRNQEPQLSGEQAIVEQNGVKFGESGVV